MTDSAKQQFNKDSKPFIFDEYITDLETSLGKEFIVKKVEGEEDTYSITVNQDSIFSKNPDSFSYIAFPVNLNSVDLHVVYHWGGTITIDVFVDGSQVIEEQKVQPDKLKNALRMRRMFVGFAEFYAAM